MHTFYSKVLFYLQCLRHVSNIQVFILRKTCTCSFMVFLSCFHISSLVDGRMCFILLLVLITYLYNKARFKKSKDYNTQFHFHIRYKFQSNTTIYYTNILMATCFDCTESSSGLPKNISNVSTFIVHSGIPNA